MTDNFEDFKQFKRRCRICDGEFEPRFRLQKICSDCYLELADEWPEDETKEGD
jgi:hypothetical protein